MIFITASFTTLPLNPTSVIPDSKSLTNVVAVNFTTDNHHIFRVTYNQCFLINDSHRYGLHKINRLNLSLVGEMWFYFYFCLGQHFSCQRTLHLHPSCTYSGQEVSFEFVWIIQHDNLFQNYTREVCGSSVEENKRNRVEMVWKKVTYVCHRWKSTQIDSCQKKQYKNLSFSSNGSRVLIT